MKKAQLFAAVVLVLSSLPMLAQQTPGSEAGPAMMRPVNGELASKLDAKSAKAGDQVVVKTTESFKAANGTVIPKGSRLVGTVTEVQAYGPDSVDSHLGIRFDRAELKGGQSVAIHSEIRSLALPVSAASMDSMGGDASMGSMGGNSMGSGRGSVAGGGPAGGALGGSQASAGGIANNPGRAAGTINSSADDTAQAAAGRPAGSVPDASGKPHASGIPGILLSGRGSDASSASGTLWASKKNVHLDGGTQIVLAVAVD